MLARRSLLLLVAACLLLAGSALAAGPPTVDWHTLSSGGGRATEGAYTLDYSLGQPVTGPASHTGTALCAGFWCAMASGPLPVPAEGIYLPIVLRYEP